MSTRSVLLIEDDVDIQNYLKSVLELKGFEVETASNGKEGLDLLEHGHVPGIIILDLAMPVMDGERFLEKQRCNPEFGSLPVIAMTGAKDKNRPRQADEFLRKPIDVTILIEALEKYIEAEAPAPDQFH
jgi:CheY-like chemotaxis protein